MFMENLNLSIWFSGKLLKQFKNGDQLWRIYLKVCS